MKIKLKDLIVGDVFTYASGTRYEITAIDDIQFSFTFEGYEYTRDIKGFTEVDVDVVYRKEPLPKYPGDMPVVEFLALIGA